MLEVLAYMLLKLQFSPQFFLHKECKKFAFKRRGSVYIKYKVSRTCVSRISPFIKLYGYIYWATLKKGAMSFRKMLNGSGFTGNILFLKYREYSCI